jgi:hypothetical protein
MPTVSTTNANLAMYDGVLATRCWLSKLCCRSSKDFNLLTDEGMHRLEAGGSFVVSAQQKKGLRFLNLVLLRLPFTEAVFRRNGTCDLVADAAAVASRLLYLMK